MHIQHIETTATNDGKIVYSVSLSFSGAPTLPHTLWFEVDATQVENISLSHDAFVAALLLPAMYWGEDIIIQGEISSQLHRNLHRIQDTLHTWKPKWFTKVRIQANNYTNVPAAPGQSWQVSLFSGGVDSLFAIKSRLHSSCPISHAVLIHGFDIPLSDKRTFQILEREYQTVLKGLDVELLTVSTNLGAFHRVPDWDTTCIAAIISPCLLFKNKTKQIVYPEINTYSYVRNKPCVNFLPNPIAPLFATDNTIVTNADGAVPKTSKVQALACWRPARQAIRVCWEKPDGKQNCGLCAKCTITMANLSLVDSLDQYATFPAALDRKVFRSSRYPLRRLYFPLGLFSIAMKQRCFFVMYDCLIIVGGSLLCVVTQAVGSCLHAPITLSYRCSLQCKKRSPRYALLVKKCKKILSV